MDGSSVISRVLISERGRQESRTQRRGCDDGSRGHSEVIPSFEGGRYSLTNKRRRSLETGIGKEMGATLQPPKRIQSC